MHASNNVLVSLVWTLGIPDDQQRNVKSPELSPQSVLHICWNVYCYVPYGHLADFLSTTKLIVLVIERTVLVPGVCPCIRKSYDALCLHRRGRGDKQKNVNFHACHHGLSCLWHTQDGLYASQIVLVSLVRTLGSPW